MRSFRIELVESSFAKGGSLVTGEVWFSIDGVDFPSRNWNDFAVTILGWWVEAAISLAAGEEATFGFMDGPWLVEAKPLPNQAAELVFIDDHSPSPTIVATRSLPQVEIRNEIRRAAALVISVCVSGGWHTQELDLLRERTAVLTP